MGEKFVFLISGFSFKEAGVAIGRHREREEERGADCCWRLLRTLLMLLLWVEVAGQLHVDVVRQGIA